MLLCSEHFTMVCTPVRLLHLKLTIKCLVLECWPFLCCFLLVILQCKMLYCCMDFFVFPTLWLLRSHFQHISLFLSILFQAILKCVQHYQQYLIFLLNFIVVKTKLLKPVSLFTTVLEFLNSCSCDAMTNLACFDF